MILSCGLNTNSPGIVIVLIFNGNEYLGNDILHVEVAITTKIPYTFIDSVFFTVTKNSKSPLKYTCDHVAEVGKQYEAKITRYNPASGDGYTVIYHTLGV